MRGWLRRESVCWRASASDQTSSYVQVQIKIIRHDLVVFKGLKAPENDSSVPLSQAADEMMALYYLFESGAPWWRLRRAQ